ncbi:MAG: PEP-CTERM sorting domain-containing protein [Candidatus Acidiferrales bacterium]
MKLYKCLFPVLGLCLSLLPSISLAGPISIQVGYADSLRSSPLFPSNFCNGGTQFDGSSGATCSQTFDAGAIRIVNNSGQVMNVTDVLVTIGAASFDLWNAHGAFTIASGTDEVLTQTNSFNFDTSDLGNAFAPGNSVLPTIKINFSLGGGASQSLTFTDSGQVLNTGGFDLLNGLNGSCPGGNNAGNQPGACNESLQWRDISTTGIDNPGGSGTPEPASFVLLLTGAAGVLGFARRRLFS